MKKISAVLLVLVLVGSVAFAGFTGLAETTFKYDLDTGAYGFENDTEFDLELVFHEALGEAKGEGDIYAEIAASFTFSYERDENDNLMIIPGDFEVSFDYAKIVGENWYVGILGALDRPNYAASAIDLDDDDDPADYIPTGLEAKAGIELGYGGYVASLSIDDGDTSTDPAEYDFFGTIETPEFTLADGLTLAFGAAGRMANVDGANAVSGSVKGAYSADAYAVSFASDMGYDNESFDADVAVALAVDPVTIDLYYATINNSPDATGLPAADLLSARAVFTIDPFDITLKGMDLINAKDLYASVGFAATDAIKVTVGGGYVIDTKDVSVDGLVEYTAAQYTASAEANYGYNVDAETSTLGLNLGVESDKLVNGATLSASYEVDDLITAEDKGVLSTGVKIAF